MRYCLKNNSKTNKQKPAIVWKIKRNADGREMGRTITNQNIIPHNKSQHAAKPSAGCGRQAKALVKIASLGTDILTVS